MFWYCIIWFNSWSVICTMQSSFWEISLQNHIWSCYCCETWILTLHVSNCRSWFLLLRSAFLDFLIPCNQNQFIFISLLLWFPTCLICRFFIILKCTENENNVDKPRQNITVQPFKKPAADMYSARTTLYCEGLYTLPLCQWEDLYAVLRRQYYWVSISSVQERKSLNKR